MDWNTKISVAKGYISEYDKGYQDGSKETAEKFREVVLNIPRIFTSTQDTFTKEDVETFLNIGLNTVICEVCKLAKQFGVEHGR